MKYKKLLIFIVLLFILTSCTNINNKTSSNLPLETSSENLSSPTSSNIVSSPSSLPVSSKELTEEEIINEKVETYLENMTLSQKIGQLFIITPNQLETAESDTSDNVADFSQIQKSNIVDYSPGGIIFFDNNINNGEELKQYINELQDNSKIPLFISVDEEGGQVSRLSGKPDTGIDHIPPMGTIGENGDPKEAFELGQTLGSGLNSLGFNLNFAPVADINTNPYNPVIGDRSFGSTPEIVSSMVSEEVKGMQSKNVSACLKHFPGHGDTSSDTHTGRVILDVDAERLNETELKPFKAGIESDADFIMISHISLPQITEDDTPSSMSSIIIKDILRKDLNFNGIVITDALNMSAITNYNSSAETALNCINAGVNILLMPDSFKNAFTAIKDAVDNKEIKESLIDESVRKILYIKFKRNIIN